MVLFRLVRATTKEEEEKIMVMTRIWIPWRSCWLLAIAQISRSTRLGPKYT